MRQSMAAMYNVILGDLLLKEPLEEYPVSLLISKGLYLPYKLAILPCCSTILALSLYSQSGM